MSEIVSEIAKYVGLWFVAGFIVTVIWIIVILLSGGFVKTISELIFQIVIFAILLYFIEHHS